VAAGFGAEIGAEQLVDDLAGPDEELDAVDDQGSHGVDRRGDCLITDADRVDVLVGHLAPTFRGVITAPPSDAERGQLYTICTAS
jgi:hypothetical protein